MKKVGLFATALVMMAMVSCKENICIECKKIIDDGTKEELCSRDRAERQTFQTNWIKEGYNCQTVEE